MQTINNVDYGTTITAASAYTGSTPTTTQGSATDYPFEGWNPASATVQGDTVFTAKFGAPAVVEEITDSWDTIIANIDNGTYATKYKVGNYKPLDLGTEGIINMQIVAIDADELADSSGTAPLTFIGMELLATKKAFDNYHNNSGGWGASATGIRSFLSNTITPLLPTNIKNRIQKVNKTYYLYESQSEGISEEKIWIPSARELNLSMAFEGSGPEYNKIYTDDASRIKKINQTAEEYWTRSAYKFSNMTFVAIMASGLMTNEYSNTSCGIALGFCLGLEPETITDDWSTILANSSPSTSYSIGDTKYLDLGTQGKHMMEIVAFDEDDKADGSGKAKITWISKTLLNTAHRMNRKASSSGGWLNCEMRTYLKETIKPLIPATVRNGIVEVTKVQSTVTDGTLVIDGQTSTEDIWIPSNHEVFSTVTTYESTGATYTKFASDADRIKKSLSGEASIWWLRSARNSANFSRVRNNGSGDSFSANSAYGILLGFCTD